MKPSNSSPSQSESPNALLSLLKVRMQDYQEQQTPLYIKVQLCLRHAIETGALSVGEAIPTERTLASALEVSRITVRNAIKGLVNDGFLNQQQGAGTFVSAHIELPLSQLTSFSDDMKARGFKTHAQWLDRSIDSATPEEAMALNLSPGSEVVRLYRLRYADQQAVALEHATLPKEFLPDPDLVDESLYETLKSNNLHPKRALQRIKAQLCQQAQADLLDIEVGSAILYIQRCSFLPDGRPLEYTCSHYRGDSYDFIAEMHTA